MEKVRALRTTSRQYTPPGDELENGMGKRLLRMPLMNEAHAVDQRLSDESFPQSRYDVINCGLSGDIVTEGEAHPYEKCGVMNCHRRAFRHRHH
jgi:hypothetical protein